MRELDDLNRKLSLLLKEPENAKRYLHVGIILCGVADWDNAERYLSRAYALDAADGDILRHYAIVSYHRQDYQRAAQLCRAGLEIDDQNLALLEMLGDSCYLLGDYEQAAAACKKLCKMLHEGALA